MKIHPQREGSLGRVNGTPEKKIRSRDISRQRFVWLRGCLEHIREKLPFFHVCTVFSFLRISNFCVCKLHVNAFYYSRLAGSWAAIDITKTYVVGTNNYIAAGKDGYLTFGEVTGVDSYMNYAQTMMDYAEEVKTLTAPAKAEMTTQSYIAPDGTVHTVVTPPASSGATIFGHAVAFFAFVGAFAAVM